MFHGMYEWRFRDLSGYLLYSVGVLFGPVDVLLSLGVCLYEASWRCHNSCRLGIFLYSRQADCW